MPKIFLIKDRLHQQQLRLLEQQNLISNKNEDRLGPIRSPSPCGSNEPLALVSKKKDILDQGMSLRNSLVD